MPTFGFIVLVIALAVFLLIFTRGGDSHGVIAALIVYGTAAVLAVIGLFHLYSYIHEHVKIIWQ